MLVSNCAEALGRDCMLLKTETICIEKTKNLGVEK